MPVTISTLTNTGLGTPASSALLHASLQRATVSGGTVVDLFHQNIQGANGIAQNGVETLPRFIYRARWDGVTVRGASPAS
jgi:hypothetical protein